MRLCPDVEPALIEHLSTCEGLGASPRLALHARTIPSRCLWRCYVLGMQPYQPVPGRAMVHSVDATFVLNGQFSPAGYPFPYLAVIGNVGLPNLLDSLLTAVGMLKERGWELVSVANTGGTVLQLTAFLKRMNPQ